MPPQNQQILPSTQTPLYSSLSQESGFKLFKGWNTVIRH